MNSLLDKQVISALTHTIGIESVTFASQAFEEEFNEFLQVSNTDLAQLAIQAHSLKSSSRLLGAEAVSHLCQQLEKDAKSEQSNNIESLLTQIKNLQNPTLKELYKYLDSIKD